MPRQPKEIQIVHASADYYEPLFRARFVRAMKKLQVETSVTALAATLGNAKQARNIIPRKKIEEALTQSVKKVLRDAFMRGGKLGAEHVKDLLRG